MTVPAGYKDGVPSNVVFNFHGAGSNSAEQYEYADFVTLAERDNAILVTPDARPNPMYDGAQAWEANLRESDTDLEFVEQLVQVLENEYCTGEFFATGMSSGGDIVSALACLEETPFKAFAPVTYLYYNASECAEAPPRPIVYFHGTDDTVVPMAGSAKPWFDPPVAEVVSLWAKHNGCAPDPVESTVSENATLFKWRGCEAALEWYLIEGGGHTWPGTAEVEDTDDPSGEIDASAIIWEFFSRV